MKQARKGTGESKRQRKIVAFPVVCRVFSAYRYYDDEHVHGAQGICTSFLHVFCLNIRKADQDVKR